MDTPLFRLFDVIVTPWKLVGYLGVLLFAGRWVVQVLATRRQGRPVFPGLFWTMSISGSALLLAYFIWGKSDSVGVMSNLFPMAVALYNILMHRRDTAMRARSSERVAHDDARVPLAAAAANRGQYAVRQPGRDVAVRMHPHLLRGLRALRDRQAG